MKCPRTIAKRVFPFVLLALSLVVTASVQAQTLQITPSHTWSPTVTLPGTTSSTFTISNPVAGGGYTVAITSITVPVVAFWLT